LIIWCSTDLVFVFLPFVFGGVGRWLNLVIGLDFDRFNAVMGVIDLGCPRYLVLLGFDLELCRVMVNRLIKDVFMVFLALAARLCARSLID
jgi:hypothetical protein